MSDLDVDEVFNNAICFVLAHRHMSLMIEPRLNPALTIASAVPMLMMGALTIELLLKTCHALDHGKVPTGHDLGNLFRNLPMPTRIAIAKEYRTGPEAAQRARLFETIKRTTGKVPPTDLAILLEGASKAFEAYRYSYEERPEGYPDFLLGDLPPAIVRVLQARHPKWRNWSPAPPKAMLAKETTQPRAV